MSPIESMNVKFCTNIYHQSPLSYYSIFNILYI